MMMLIEYVKIIMRNFDEELMLHQNHFYRKEKFLFFR